VEDEALIEIFSRAIDILEEQVRQNPGAADVDIHSRVLNELKVALHQCTEQRTGKLRNLAHAVTVLHQSGNLQHEIMVQVVKDVIANETMKEQLNCAMNELQDEEVKYSPVLCPFTLRDANQATIQLTSRNTNIKVSCQLTDVELSDIMIKVIRARVNWPKVQIQLSGQVKETITCALFAITVLTSKDVALQSCSQRQLQAIAAAAKWRSNLPVLAKAWGFNITGECQKLGDFQQAIASLRTRLEETIENSQQQQTHVHVVARAEKLLQLLGCQDEATKLARLQCIFESKSGQAAYAALCIEQGWRQSKTPPRLLDVDPSRFPCDFKHPGVVHVKCVTKSSPLKAAIMRVELTEGELVQVVMASMNAMELPVQEHASAKEQPKQEHAPAGEPPRQEHAPAKIYPPRQKHASAQVVEVGMRSAASESPAASGRKKEEPQTKHAKCLGCKERSVKQYRLVPCGCMVLCDGCVTGILEFYKKWPDGNCPGVAPERVQHCHRAGCWTRLQSPGAELV